LQVPLLKLDDKGANFPVLYCNPIATAGSLKRFIDFSALVTQAKAQALAVDAVTNCGGIWPVDESLPLR